MMTTRQTIQFVINVVNVTLNGVATILSVVVFSHLAATLRREPNVQLSRWTIFHLFATAVSVTGYSFLTLVDVITHDIPNPSSNVSKPLCMFLFTFFTFFVSLYLLYFFNRISQSLEYVHTLTGLEIGGQSTDMSVRMSVTQSGSLTSLKDILTKYINFSLFRCSCTPKLSFSMLI